VSPLSAAHRCDDPVENLEVGEQRPKFGAQRGPLDLGQTGEKDLNVRFGRARNGLGLEERGRHAQLDKTADNPVGGVELHREEEAHATRVVGGLQTLDEAHREPKRTGGILLDRIKHEQARLRQRRQDVDQRMTKAEASVTLTDVVVV
jgi:hypothetical protein